MGPMEDGKYVHYLCQNGKVTSWWVDGNSRTEDAPQGRLNKPDSIRLE